MRIRQYIFRQLVWWVIGIAVCLVCIVWLTQSLRFVDMMVNRGLSPAVFLYYTVLLLPTFLRLILPIALFAAILFTYTKFVMDNELVVMRTAGLSQVALVRPAITLALALTVIGYILTLYLMPSSYRAFKDLDRGFRNAYSAVLLQEGVFSQIIDGVTVYVRSRTPNGELLGIMVHDKRNPARPVTLMAERGAIVAQESGPHVVLRNGSRQEIGARDGKLSLLYFDEYTFAFDKLIEASIGVERHPYERYLNELLHPSAGGLRRYGAGKLWMEAHDRLASPLLNLAFAFIGLAFLLTGDFNRRGQTRRVIGAIAAVVVIEAAFVGAKSAGIKEPAIWPLLYGVPLLPGTLAAIYLLLDPRPRIRPSEGVPA